jgi:PhnB protein
MKSIDTYLLFNGNCREAMEFYANCLGADLNVMGYGDGPEPCTEADRDKVMHARIKKGSVVLMASDAPPSKAVEQGNNFALTLNCESIEETERVFKAIGKGGKVIMPLSDTFWGAHFGMLSDQFGVTWMFSFEKDPRSHTN